jgi:hypothetical protein
MSSMHLDEEQIQRFLHGEVSPTAAVSVREHLGACDECRRRVTEAEREERRVLDLLRHLDHPSPRVDVGAIVAGGRRRGRGWGRWAASILLAFAAGAAYAAPGSPLPGLVGRLVTWLDGPPQRRAQPAQSTDTAPPARADEVGQGLAVVPGDRFTIVFSSDQPGGVAAVSMTDGAEVVVRAVGGAATFTSDADRLSIDNGGSSARFQIQIPRNAARVDIWVAGHRVFSKEPSGVVAEGRRDAEGRYLLPLSRPGS